MVKRSKSGRIFPLKLPRWLSAFVAGLAFIFVIALVLAVLYSERSLPFIKLAGIDVGNQTREQIIERLNQITPQPIKISAAEHSVTIDPKAIELTYDSQKTSDRIIALTNLDNLLKFEFLKPAEFVFELNEQKLDNLIAELTSKVDHQAQDAKFEFKKGKLTVNDTVKTGRQLEKESLKQTIIKKFANADFNEINATIIDIQPTITGSQLETMLGELESRLKDGLKLEFNGEVIDVEQAQLLSFLKPIAQQATVKLEPDQGKIKAYVKTLAKQIDRTLRDAQLKMADGRVEVFQASQEGRKLDQEKTTDLLVKAIKEEKTSLTLPVKITQPNVTTASVNDLGIQELIGSATTSFKGSPENRKHNIATGAGVLNGILVAAGQVFSTIEALGNPGPDGGYLPELVIKENKTIPEFGGGLCQVSTTLFRAVVNTGLPIVERQNHSWRINYYEPPAGFDATVYFPKPDLKFKNDTPGWILIQSRVEGIKLTFEVFGTKDGRRSDVSTKLLSSTKPPAAVYIESDTVARGTTKQVEKPHPGGKAVAIYKVYDKDGNLINDQTFSSSYKAVPARFLVGTGEPAPAPAEVPPPSSETPPAQ